MTQRKIDFLEHGRATSDGAGVRLTRVISERLQKRLDPFLMLDVFGSEHPDEYIAGFPNHPHRGFETMTYMLKGRMRHRDSAGHEGLLQNGDMQWITAGSGVIHSEMPEQHHGEMEGFQLWINLPAQRKMTAPWYRDIGHEKIPLHQENGVTLLILAGETFGKTGAITREQTQPLVLDIHLPPEHNHLQPLPAAANACIYVYRGEINIGGETVSNNALAVLDNPSDSTGVLLQAGPQREARGLLLAGMPLNEPIVQYGPFVMNTTQQIRQAIADYRAGHMG